MTIRTLSTPLATVLATALLAACTQSATPAAAPTPTAAAPAPVAAPPASPSVATAPASATGTPGTQEDDALPVSTGIDPSLTLAPGMPPTATSTSTPSTSGDASSATATSTVATPTTSPTTPDAPASAPTPAPVASAADAKLKKTDPLRAQVLLDRAFFSPGEIDGANGSNQRRAVNLYQAAHDLPVTGTLDTATWASLDKDTAPVLTDYVLTADDVAGPFAKTPAKPAEMAKLTSLPYETVQEKIAEKFHISPALLKKLNPAADVSVAGTSITVPYVAPAEQFPKPAKLVVDKSDSALLLVDASDHTLGAFPITSGSAEFPLPIGDWKITGLTQKPVWHFDPKLIAGTKKTDTKQEVPAGPNNPVGVVWIGLTKEHYGIHGTPHPDRIGKTESNGCIRMTNWNVMALSKVARRSMLVTMRE